MNSRTRALLERVESWPSEDQEELADFIREVESRRTGLYRLSDEERAAVREGLEDARQGNFATDEEIEAFYQLHRGA
jgi:predicted transcriptional regulator